MTFQAISQTDPKRAQVFEATFALVQRYGFSRITMDDIAKECGMSRPALYQFFRNKQEIYRSITRHMMDASLKLMSVELAGDGPLEGRLFRAIKFGVLDMISEMEATTHGAELLDLKNDLSGDIISEFVEAMTGIVANGFSELADRLPLPAEAMAANLSLWLEGMKQHVKEPTARDDALRGFLAMQFAGIRAS